MCSVLTNGISVTERFPWCHSNPRASTPAAYSLTRDIFVLRGMNFGAPVRIRGLTTSGQQHWDRTTAPTVSNFMAPGRFHVVLLL